MKAPASRRGAALQPAMTPLLGAFLASSPRLFNPAHPASSGVGEIAGIGGYWMRLLQGEMKPRQGTHYQVLISELSREKTAEVTAALNSLEVLHILERNPIARITIERTGSKVHTAEYDWREKSIIVNSARKLGVHFGEEFRPGATRNMSAATSDRLESMRRSLLQETAHHIENSTPGASGVIRKAFADPAKRPITGYAGSSAEEYFAESFVAFMVEPKALASYDPVGSTMVLQALALMRMHR